MVLNDGVVKNELSSIPSIANAAKKPTTREYYRNKKTVSSCGLVDIRIITRYRQPPGITHNVLLLIISQETRKMLGKVE